MWEENDVRDVWPLFDVSYSDECQMKKYFQYAENRLCNIVFIYYQKTTMEGKAVWRRNIYGNSL